MNGFFYIVPVKVTINILRSKYVPTIEIPNDFKYLSKQPTYELPKFKITKFMSPILDKPKL